MLVYKDRVLESIDALVTGTGTLTLDGEVDGFRDFSAIGNGNQCFYSLWEVDADGNPNGGWEVGIGQYTSSGSLLARLNVLASSTAGSGAVPVIASKSAVVSGTGASVATNAPSGVAVGDLLILFLAFSGATAPTKPSTWDLLGLVASANSSIVVYTKRANGSSDDTPTVALAASSNHASSTYRITGAGDFELSVAVVDTTSDTDTSIDAFVCSGNNRLHLLAFNLPSSTTVSSWPFSLVSETSHTSSTGLSIGSAERDSGSASAGTATFTIATRKAWCNLLIKPAAYDRINLGSGTKRVMCTVAAAKIKLPDVQMFTTAGTHTWVKPPGCKLVEVVLIGGGGGGGSGRKGATADAGRTGGRSGAGGGITTGTFDADDLGAVETVTVAAGGTGGVSQTTNSTDGNAGTNGGASTFGNWLRAGAGAAGGGGTTANQGAAVAGGNDSLVSLAGGSAAGVTASTGVGASAANNTAARPTGGGAGGGLVQTTDALGAAGSGGTLTGSSVFPTAVAGGAAGTAGGAGGNGNTFEFLRGLTIGTGGGGGHGSATTDAGAGGNGGNYGAGGGGGGASKDATGNSGAGGDGATGACMVISS
jgi:hypothetical protein